MPSLLRLLRRGRGEPLPPGPEGHLLFVGPYNGGVGGIERLTRAFADFVEGSGFTATMVFRHPEPVPGPYAIAASPRLRLLAERDWSAALEEGDHRATYVIAPGLRARRWVPRLARVRSPRVFLDLPARRKFDAVCDAVHREAPRDEPCDRPHVVAIPDPRTTWPEGRRDPDAGAAPSAHHLTVFTPYGDVKGARHVRPFLEATDRRLVWCYDPATFRRNRRAMRRIRDATSAARHPRLDLREGLPPAEIHALLRSAAGYVCFSDDEGLGWSMLDALVAGVPLCARRVGVCRAVPGFRATEHFARPVFGTYAPPPIAGFAPVFRDLAARAEVTGRVTGRRTAPRT